MSFRCASLQLPCFRKLAGDPGHTCREVGTKAFLPVSQCGCHTVCSAQPHSHSTLNLITNFTQVFQWNSMQIFTLLGEMNFLSLHTDLIQQGEFQKQDKKELKQIKFSTVCKSPFFTDFGLRCCVKAVRVCIPCWLGGKHPHRPIVRSTGQEGDQLKLHGISFAATQHSSSMAGDASGCSNQAPRSPDPGHTYKLSSSGPANAFSLHLLQQSRFLHGSEVSLWAVQQKLMPLCSLSCNPFLGSVGPFRCRQSCSQDTD